MSAENTNEMKGGHAPAEMIGGRRIANRKDRKLSDSIENSNSESSDEVVREIVDCDLPAKMEKSYPTQAIKKAHEKVVPNKQFQRDTRGINTMGHCFQPRKETH